MIQNKYLKNNEHNIIYKTLRTRVNDKLKQIDAMIEYFEQPEIEEYEKCQYLLDVKKDLDQYRYML